MPDHSYVGLILFVTVPVDMFTNSDHMVNMVYCMLPLRCDAPRGWCECDTECCNCAAVGRGAVMCTGVQRRVCDVGRL